MPSFNGRNLVADEVGQGKRVQHGASDPPGAIAELIARACQRLCISGTTEIDVDSSFPAGLVGRAAYRHWVRDVARQPLVEIDLHLLDADTRAWAERVAAGGMVLVRVGPGESAGPLSPFADAVTLVERRGLAMGPSPAELARLLALDAVHIEAIDPSLATVRTALLGHCRSEATVSLVGAPGSGRAALAAWAHTVSGTRAPLRRIPGDRGVHRSTGWLLVEDPADLDEDARARIRRELETRAASVRPPRRAHTPGTRPRHAAFDALNGDSAALCRVLAQAERAARAPLPVLIVGEPGVGKELLARAVHAASGRSGPLVFVDVGSISPELVESELFGHVRGAFTGAERDRAGAFRSADRGTLVLDELGNMPLAAQARLLRVLQQGEVRPVGSDRVVRVDVRVLAATNADLDAMARAGRFREDLLRRLDAVTLHMPPLRERGRDVLHLARTFAAEALGREADPDWLSDEAANRLLEHGWPGNTRELRHVVLRAVLEAAPGPVRPRHLSGLDPDERRAGPCLVATTRSELDHIGLPPTLQAQLTAVVLDVPSLRDRGRAAIRTRVLHALDGVPISPDALDALVSLPWRGDLPELAAAVRVLVAERRPIDAERLRERLPHLASTDPRPIALVLHPTREPHGEIAGFRRMVRADRLALGSAAMARPERGSALHTTPVTLASLPPAAAPACVVERVHDGLRVRRPADSAVPLTLFALDGGDAAHDLSPGEATDVGPAFELVLRPGDRATQLFAFLGHDAIDRFGSHALSRVGSPAPAPPESTTSRPRVWRLDPAEIALLNHVVTSFRGGSFSAHLTRGLGGDPRRGHRLRRYVLGVRPTQYCGRIYAYPPNGPLREDLAARIEAAADPEGLRALLPVVVRRHVGG